MRVVSKELVRVVFIPRMPLTEESLNGEGNNNEPDTDQRNFCEAIKLELCRHSALAQNTKAAWITH